MMQGANVRTDRDLKRTQELNDKVETGDVKILLADVFIRDPKRKPREPWVVYKRSMRNHNRALKVRLRGGPKASLLLDVNTLQIVW